MKEYYVYILANASRTIYIGVTNDLERRVYEHKQGLIPGFTSRYGINQLVYFEAVSDVFAAIEREKQLKGWVRRKKISLVDATNPKWEDLSAEWFNSTPTSTQKAKGARILRRSPSPTSLTPRSSE